MLIQPAWYGRATRPVRPAYKRDCGFTNPTNFVTNFVTQQQSVERGLIRGREICKYANEPMQVYALSSRIDSAAAM